MFKITKSKLIGLAAPVISLAAPAAALAQGQLVPSELTKTPNLVNVIQALIRFVLIFAFVVAFVMLLIGGIRWIMAGGDEKAVEKARNTITAALIGLVIILVAYAIIRVVESFFGLTILGSVVVPTVTSATAAASKT
jgi:hypothetical protein